MYVYVCMYAYVCMRMDVCVCRSEVDVGCFFFFTISLHFERQSLTELGVGQFG